MAVPTRDASGHLTGVLVGALMLDRFGLTHGALDVVGPDVAILDRAGRSAPGRRRRAPRNLVLAHSSARHRRHRRHPWPGRLGRPCDRLQQVRDPGLDRRRSTSRARCSSADARRGFFLQARADRRRRLDRALPDRVHRCCAAAARPSASAPRAPAARPHAHPRQRIARQRGLRRPRGRSRTTPSRERSASSRSRTEDHHGLSLSASADGAFPSSPAARDLVVDAGGDAGATTAAARS